MDGNKITLLLISSEKYDIIGKKKGKVSTS